MNGRWASRWRRAPGATTRTPTPSWTASSSVSLLRSRRGFAIVQVLFFVRFLRPSGVLFALSVLVFAHFCRRFFRDPYVVASRLSLLGPYVAFLSRSGFVAPAARRFRTLKCVRLKYLFLHDPGFSLRRSAFVFHPSVTM